MTPDGPVESRRLVAPMLTKDLPRVGAETLHPGFVCMDVAGEGPGPPPVL